MNHLELFSGTHSFGKVSSKFGYEVYSLDIELGDTNDDYKSQHHFKEDILTWNYKQFPVGFFKIITASPVCTWWSHLRRTWIGRKIKEHNGLICTQELLDEDIEKFGVPMVDKIFEIIDYFDPEYYIIENPSTGKMKEYINDLIPYYDVDYCRYSDWGYKKTTRFWTNIEDLEFIPCDNKCDNMVEKQHKIVLANGYEMIDGKKVLCNTKEKRQLLHKDRMGTSKTINDNGKIVRVNSAELRTKYKDYENINKNYSNGTTKLDRYRIPKKLIEKFFKKNIC
tara:strand:- start:108 stop:950 length:843 start_codon:yes stop_codon:yes gene_type:complete